MTTELNKNESNKHENIEDLMKIENSYPDPADPELQYKLYKKREFYYHKTPKRADVKEYADIKEYRDNICARNFALHEHQAMLGNFINPNTPYKGVLIFHGLGSGKCILGSSAVYINGTLMKIEDVWNTYKTGDIIVDDENGQWSKTNEELVVNSYNNKTGKIEKQKIKHLYRELFDGELREIILDNGNKITITDAHKLLTHGGFTNILKVGDSVCIPKVLYNCPEKNKLNVTPELAHLIGWQIGKGYEHENTVNFTLKDKNILEQIKLIAQKVGKYYKINMNIMSSKKNIYVLSIHSSEYVDFLKNNGYNFGKNKCIPDFIMNMPLENIKIFLKAYFDAKSNENIIEMLCESKIIEQLNILFRLFGTYLKIEDLLTSKSVKNNNKIHNTNYTYLNTTSTYNNLNSDDSEKEVHYVKIVSINKIKHCGYVYDLEINNLYHNYVVNDIITKNTCAGISIAEKFKPLVQKYNTKIYILVGGPLIKENWKHHILLCTGETYLKYQDKSVYVDEAEKTKAEKNALIQALQYYKFMSYKSFYKHVIGEKITDRQTGQKGKATYRKTDEGEFERDISVDRIYNLNNTVIIVDEAHNLTGNTYGDALKYIIKNSINLKIVLMSGTPMKNLGSDIVELINFLRPLDSQIERDKIFTSNKGHMLEFKDGGLSYLKNMMRGYVSHVRGADPLTFAKRIDKGEKPDGLLFTKVLRCMMLPFQKKTYLEASTENDDDTLDRKSEAVANFVFPGLSSDRKELTGYYAGEGMNLVKNQLKVNSELINKKLSKLLFGNENERDLIYVTQDGRSISGKILKMPYLKYFSIKFYRALKKISRLVWGQKGASTAFVYSNLVKVGISMFHEILLQNGYLEYQEDSSNYQFTQNTVCYFCGKPYGAHKSETVIDENFKLNTNDIDYVKSETVIEELNFSNTSSDYKTNKNYKKEVEKKGPIPPHTFRPATFITVTGKSNEEALEAMPEDKMNIIKNIFNKLENKDGKYIKFVLGSRVMNEGISLKHIAEVHILDAYFNFGRIDQVIGRGIRWCSHYKLMNEENVFPEVLVYKYVVALENSLSSEEELYQKAELKYLLIKKIERAMKEVAIDCPLNMNANMFKEEIDQYEKCVPINDTTKINADDACPAICDYTKCSYSCDDAKLNMEYYDPNRQIYKKISKDKLDYTTFTHGLARNEIDHAKDIIKELYITGYMYTLEDILTYVKSTYDDEKRELFDSFFAFKALDELIPMTENDFNNFKDTIIDKHNRPGYLIYVDKYYIFQPFDQNEDVPMYYRTTVTKTVSQQLSLYNYLKNNVSYQQLKDIKGKRKGDDKSLVKDDQPYYNFDDAMDYYDSREEYDFVGFIDKEVSRRKNKSADEIKDVFKLREKRAKILQKKRESGLPSLKGAVCSTSKSKKYLDKVAKKIGVTIDKGDTRIEVCNKIENKLLHLEKYGTTKDKNKFSYVLIPVDHPSYPFPYNLEDRIEHITDKIKNEISGKIDIDVKTKKKDKGPEKGLPAYEIHIKNNDKLKEHEEFLKKIGANKSGSEWIILVE